MDADNLVRMANRIGQFFVAFPDRDEALDGIAEHIRKFWDPRMRTALRAHLAESASGPTPVDAAVTGLDPIVRDALARHPELLGRGAGPA